MAITVWGFALAWLDAALVFVLVMAVLGPTVTGPRMAAKGPNLYYPATAGYDLASGWGTPNLGDFGKVLGAF